MLKRISVSVNNAEFLPSVIEYIEQGHTAIISLKGNSMLPFLVDGRDKALLGKAINIKVGDAVLAEIMPSKFVLHRIVKIEGEDVTLLGDGNLASEHCRVKDIKASVIGFYRKGHTTIDSVNGRKWRLYSFFWTRLYPIRRYILAIYRRTIL